MREEISDMSEDDETGERARWAPDLCKIRSDDSDTGPGPPLSDPPPPFSDQVLENVLENVLEFLTSRRDRSAASAVCRSWYRAEAQTRRELFIGNCYAVAPHRAIERFRSIKSVVLKGKPRFADFNLVPYGWGAHFHRWVNLLGAVYRGLERICLKRMIVTDNDLTIIAESFPFFRDLVLICCEGFSTLGLAVIAERCRYCMVKQLELFLFLSKEINSSSSFIF
jgi:Transport inhibitor response 1 protein domain/F-box